jgi:hypothetical protein
MLGIYKTLLEDFYPKPDEENEESEDIGLDDSIFYNFSQYKEVIEQLEDRFGAG